MLARRLWRMSAPVRRPVIRKFDHHMIKILNSASLGVDVPSNRRAGPQQVRGRAHRAPSTLDEYQSAPEQCLTRSGQAPVPPADLDLALNSVVRELARLQMQVEILQQQIEDLQSSDRDGARPENRLSVVGEIG